MRNKKVSTKEERVGNKSKASKRTNLLEKGKIDKERSPRFYEKRLKSQKGGRRHRKQKKQGSSDGCQRQTGNPQQQKKKTTGTCSRDNKELEDKKPNGKGVHSGGKKKRGKGKGPGYQRPVPNSEGEEEDKLRGTRKSED